jgi:hypothetical protein
MRHQVAGARTMWFAHRQVPPMTAQGRAGATSLTASAVRSRTIRVKPASARRLKSTSEIVTTMNTAKTHRRKAERVVVQLGDEQAQPEAGRQERRDHRPAGVGTRAPSGGRSGARSSSPDRERDHHPPSEICWSVWDEMPNRKYFDATGRDRAGRASLALSATQPPRQRHERRDTHRDQEADILAAFLPDENAEDDPAHAHGRQDGADHVDASRARVRHLADPSAAHIAMITTSARNATRHER